MSYVIMFKLHKPHLSGSIHSGHFMVSRLDDDEDEDQNNMADDASESERDNANNLEIQVPDGGSSAQSELEINYRVDSPAASKTAEQLTSWNDLDRLAKNSSGKQHQYLTYYTSSSYCDESAMADGSTSVSGPAELSPARGNTPAGAHSPGSSIASPALDTGEQPVAGGPSGTSGAELLARGLNSHLEHLHQHHHLQDHQALSVQQHLLHQRHQLSQLGPLGQLGQQSHHYHPHAVTIDTSLNKLLECMSLYYSGKLTSPKWKSFKGLRLRLKCKIRLNNMIWRAWFLQYIRGRRPAGCQFTAPIETDVHKKSETHVLEGKYWKRREKAIVDEYKKWRTFHKQKSQISCFRPSSFDWDSRVSNLASSSYDSECHFRPDYDMNITYNLDELPLDEVDQRDLECYYQLQPSMRSVEQPAIQVPPEQAYLSGQAAAALQPQAQAQPQAQQQLHQHHQEPLQAAPATQHQHHQPQTLRLTGQQGSADQAARSLKREQAIMLDSAAQQVSSDQHYVSSPDQQQQQQHMHRLEPSALNFSFDNPSQPAGAFHADMAARHTPVSPALKLTSNSNHQDESSMNPEQVGMLNLSASSHDMYPMSASSGTVTPTGLGGSECRSEQRRVCHINAEQKRRCNIKNGFDTLKSILPSISQSVNVKISKASMLQKAALYISSLSSEQKHQADEQALLKQQIEDLKQTIGAYQAQLPASGGSLGCPGSMQAREMLQGYIKRRTLDNWKFWIFSLLIEPLFESYYNSVSTSNLEESCKTMSVWLDRNCSLIALRKDLLDSLTFLSTRTNILNTPQTLPTEAVEAVRYQTTTNTGLAAAAAAAAMANSSSSNSSTSTSTTSTSSGLNLNNSTATSLASAHFGQHQHHHLTAHPHHAHHPHHSHQFSHLNLHHSVALRGQHHPSIAMAAAAAALVSGQQSQGQGQQQQLGQQLGHQQHIQQQQQQQQHHHHHQHHHLHAPHQPQPSQQSQLQPQVNQQQQQQQQQQQSAMQMAANQQQAQQCIGPVPMQTQPIRTPW